MNRDFEENYYGAGVNGREKIFNFPAVFGKLRIGWKEIMLFLEKQWKKFKRFSVTFQKKCGIIFQPFTHAPSWKIPDPK